MSKKARKTGKMQNAQKWSPKFRKQEFWKKNRNLCREVYRGFSTYQIWKVYLDLWVHDCKKWVWPIFGCKLGQSDPIMMKLKLDMSCHLLNVYTKFQNDISKHVEKSPENIGRTDGRTDGQTDRHCHGITRPFFKRAYNKSWHHQPDFALLWANPSSHTERLLGQLAPQFIYILTQKWPYFFMVCGTEAGS